MKRKLLTIAIATYNMEKYLSACIESLLVPSIINYIEILIINDGSTDNSYEIANDFQIKYPKVIRLINKPNGGYGSAINTAIDLATSKYFKTLDADDSFDSQSLVEFIRFLKKIDHDLIITKYQCENVSLNYKKVESYCGILYKTTYDFSNFCIYEKTKELGFAMHAMTYKTNILRKNNFRMSNCYYSDVDYSVYPLINVRNVIFLDIILYKYNLGRENQSVSEAGFLNHFDDHNYITKKLLKYYSDFCATEQSIISLNVGYKSIGLMYTNISLMCNVLNRADPIRAEKEILEFKNYLKHLDTDLQIYAHEFFNFFEKKIKE